MIKKLNYQEINFDKYNTCIKNSIQRKVYAEKIFLDLSCGKNWDLLIYNDYQAVMPVPYVVKLGTKIVVNPKLCQQLGVFSDVDSQEINDIFISYLQKNYVIWYYAFNDINSFSSDLRKRNNFLILPEKYEIVRQRYSPKRKRKLRLDQEVIDNSEIVLNPNINDIKKFIFKNALGADVKDLEDFVKQLIRYYENKKLDFYAFVYHNKIINLIAVYKEDYSLVLLGTYNDKEYVKLSGSSYLIDKVISENIENKIFDFEGSEVPAVEEFFRGFRPVLQPYTCISNSKPKVIEQIIKKKLFF